MVFAGTFDHLHDGHKHLLLASLRLGRFAAIGLTTDKMIEGKKGRENIEPYDARYTALDEFLSKHATSEAYCIFPIDTKEGGADKMEDLEALVVSDEIKVVQNAFDINALRAANGLKRFHILVIPRVRTQDGRPLSSSRIRDGEGLEDQELVY